MRVITIFKVNENKTASRISCKTILVTIVTMIAPSPDWFIGVTSLNLFENDSFVDEKTVILYAYDAGTDSGINYTSPNEVTEPPIPIFEIEGYPFFYDEALIPLGTFTFILQ